MNLTRWRGHSLTEYGLVAALVCVVSMVGLNLLGQTLNLSFRNMIPGPVNVANVGNLNGSSENESSGHSSGNVEGMPGGGGVDDILTSSNSNGHGDNAPGTVQTSGGLGSQDSHGSLGGQQMGGNQSGPLAGEEETPSEAEPSHGGSTGESEEPTQLSKGARIAQQLEAYSAQLRALAAKFESSSTLHHYIYDIAEKNENIGARVLEYENARNQGVSPQQGMMMGRGLGLTIGEHDKIMMIVQQGSEYPQLSLEDKETLHKLVRDSKSAASEIFTADP